MNLSEADTHRVSLVRGNRRVSLGKRPNWVARSKWNPYEMDLASRLESLLSLAEEIGIDVRAEPMGGEGGGLCQLRGKRMLFVDTSADLATRYDRTLAAMASVPELDQRYLVPEVRRDIDRQRELTRGGQDES